jgi:hypothetical protein
VLANSFLVPENCIFVGSQMLSRGLTIEGLCTSYYPKAVTLETQDMSQQCCRWYGHRLDYSDLISLFVQQRQAELFRCLTISENLLRQDIKSHMVAVLAGEVPAPLVLHTASTFSDGIPLFRSSGLSRTHHVREIVRSQGDCKKLPPLQEICDATNTLYEFVKEGSSISTRCFGASVTGCEVFCNVKNVTVAEYMEICGLSSDVYSYLCTHIRSNVNAVNVAFVTGDDSPLLRAGGRQNSFGDRNALLDVPTQLEGNKLVVAEDARAWFKFMDRPEGSDDYNYSKPFTSSREQVAPTLVTILRPRGFEETSHPYQVELLISTPSTIAYQIPQLLKKAFDEDDGEEDDEAEEEEFISDEVIEELLKSCASAPDESHKFEEMTPESQVDLLAMLDEIREENDEDVKKIIYLLGTTITPENEHEFAYMGYSELLVQKETRSVSIESMYHGLLELEFKTLFDFLVFDRAHT